jgi:hypothetical protein
MVYCCLVYQCIELVETPQQIRCIYEEGDKLVSSPRIQEY